MMDHALQPPDLEGAAALRGSPRPSLTGATGAEEGVHPACEEDDDGRASRWLS